MALAMPTNPQQIESSEDVPQDAKKIAIVHDWLVGGGAERVVLELHRMFPEAPIYTSYSTDEWRKKLDNKVVTGYLQNWPFSQFRRLLPVFHFLWFEHLDLSEYDLVISSSGNGQAKAVKVREDATHLCYCHTPNHFYWRHYDQYLDRPGFGALDPLVRLMLRLLVKPLRKKDLAASQRPTQYIANSTHIQGDIKQYYNRDSTVVFPPVDIEYFNMRTPTPLAERKGFVTVGRQVPQKHTELAVQACTQLNLPLTVIGRGPDHDKLVKLAGPSIRFITGAEATDEVKQTELANAQAFIFAAFDDFGITPIEAMASGTPVIAYRAGGALDYVVPGQTGEFFDEQTTESLAATLKAFDASTYNPVTIQKTSQRFLAANFQEQMRDLISRL